MENYQLKADEVVLYKGNVTLNGFEEVTQLILTNYNVVFITKSNIDNQEIINVETFLVADIKIYKEVPQVKRNGLNVEIYFTTGEKEFNFASKSELNKFIKEITELITGKTKTERKVSQVKDTIDFIDNTFGIDTVDLVSTAIKNGAIASLGKGINVIGKGATNGIKAIGKGATNGLKALGKNLTKKK